LAEAKKRYPDQFVKKAPENQMDQDQVKSEPAGPVRKTISQILEADKKPKRGVDFEM